MTEQPATGAQATSEPITGLFAVRDGVAPGVIAPSAGGRRGFGGHVAALALAAAYQSVPADLAVHHLHAEFLRPAIVGQPVHLHVRPYADGRSIVRRLVEASQPGEPPCATMLATFSRPDPDGLDFQYPMPPAPAPGEAWERHTAHVEIRHVKGLADPSRQQVWFRPHVRPLSPDPRLQDCALLFLSDFTVLWPTMTVHGLNPARDRRAVLGTVAHTLWFHRHGQINDWLFYDQWTPSTSGGLGHGEGRIFTPSGLLLASATQVGLLRPRPSQADS